MDSAPVYWHGSPHALGSSDQSTAALVSRAQVLAKAHEWPLVMNLNLQRPKIEHQPRAQPQRARQRPLKAAAAAAVRHLTLRHYFTVKVLLGDFAEKNKLGDLSFMRAANIEKQFVTLRPPLPKFWPLRSEVTSRDTEHASALARHAAKPRQPSHPLTGAVC